MNIFYPVYTTQGNKKIKIIINLVLNVHLTKFCFSEHGELNLGNFTISENSCSMIAETLKLIPIIKTLNLSDCLLSVDCLKIFLDVVNVLNKLSLLNLKGNQVGKHITNYISKILLYNRSIIEYV